MIKVVTGMRRCGKSYLLFEIFTSYLKENGVKENHIISVDLEDFKNKFLRQPENLYAYVESRIIEMICIIFCWMKFKCSASLRMY